MAAVQDNCRRSQKRGQPQDPLQFRGDDKESADPVKIPCCSDHLDPAGCCDAELAVASW
ncbi:UNVERIFIED_CONTAM: hypothetical protein FKN15_029462 [Acipenser sinensis]